MRSFRCSRACRSLPPRQALSWQRILDCLDSGCGLLGRCLRFNRHQGRGWSRLRVGSRLASPFRNAGRTSRTVPAFHRLESPRESPARAVRWARRFDSPAPPCRRNKGRTDYFFCKPGIRASTRSWQASTHAARRAKRAQAALLETRPRKRTAKGSSVPATRVGDFTAGLSNQYYL